VKDLEAKNERLNDIKGELRDLAAGATCSFTGTSGDVATVTQKAESTARVVPNESVPNVLSLAADKLYDLFTLHPSKGAAKSFELNVFNALPKKRAQRLLKLLTVNATPWVTFKRAA
jgi:uncharacterized protein YkwD